MLTNQINLKKTIMGSPFKMKPQSPMMKALVGKQGNLPQQLQDAIKAAPETKSKKDSPMKSYGSKKKSPMMKTEKPLSAAEIKKNKETLDYRRGKGRIKEDGGAIGARGISKGKGLEGEARVAGSAGTRGVKEDYTASGRSMGTSGRVVKEKVASKIKAKGIDLETKKAKGKSPAKSYGSKKKSPMMKKGVKSLEMQRGKK